MSANTDLQYYKELARKWLDGSISPQEKEILEKWYEDNEPLTVDIPEAFAADELSHSQRIFAEVARQISTHAEHPVKVISIKRSFLQKAAVAAVFAGVIVGGFFFFRNSKPMQQSIAKEIMPGTNGAVLRLWNGEDIDLKDTSFGYEIARLYGSQTSSNSAASRTGDYVELSTPNGKQWKMVLPDGTKVFLNAGSSLRFPVSFAGKNERMVELTGEACFDVVHDVKKPFKVKAGNEIIEDLGTVFNISSYSGEKVKATLIKGAIKIGSHILKPGQQAVVDSIDIKIKGVDTLSAVAWTDGQFSMENITVQELMNQVSRWYNIPVEYIGTPPSESFGGLLDRNVPLSNILKVLNTNGINAKVENDKIIVSSNKK
ncbi:FecR family protein [Pinibacter aurantiacus]|uniref:FecR domain-containing protein n=1 Tax=Pinibacter aurantiacus TaxID=2851599 RepID=A0A9E2SE26_9BACT|nr:FecR family protein [Pinibacter aurantiacus]MBV4358850.1 FecR domain-containing protein [Pinibacter aurantiacus]